MTDSERVASERARQRDRKQRSDAIKRIRAERAEKDGAPLGEATFIDPDQKRRTGPRPTVN